MMRSLYIFILSLILAIVSYDTAMGQNLVINELMQSNVDEIMDDLNDFPDSWVEVYNKGPKTANLANYKIGITPNPDYAFSLPAITVPVGEFCLIYCDKKDQGLHTNFRLESGKGCQVYLFMDSCIVDHIKNLPKQPSPNIAYGCDTDGSSIRGYQLTSTPGFTNAGKVCNKEHILGCPIFSEKGRVQTDSMSFSLVLTIPEGSPAGTAIYYTTNGKEPTRSDQLYSSPIHITSTTIVRAKLFCDGWLSPRSTVQSYILFPRKLTLPVISIATAEAYLSDSIIGLFPNNDTDVHKDQHNWRRPINLEYFEGEKTESIINQLCEIRIGGKASRKKNKKTLIVYAHKRFGTKRFSHEFFPDQKPGLTEFKSLSLRNAGNDFYSLYMRDAIAQRNMGSNTDLDWQAWSPTIIFINGEYYGILNIRERSNEDYVYTNYNKLEEIDLIENWDNVKKGDGQNLERFLYFYNQVGHTLEEYEQWMDCEEFINLMIMNLFHNNVDFPGNNFVMWRSRTEDGRWRWIAKDVDYSLGLNNIPYTYKIFRWFYDPNYDPKWNWGANDYLYTLLFRRLMENPDFRDLFLERCAIYMGDFLNEVGIHKVWDPMYEKIKYEYPYHRQKDNRDIDYQEEMRSVNDWLAHRTDEFYDQIRSFYQAGNPIPLEINSHEEDNPLDCLSFNGVTLSESHFNGKFFPNHKIILEAKTKEGIELIGWQIQQTIGDSITSQKFMGSTLNMDMPACSCLVIEPIYKK